MWLFKMSTMKLYYSVGFALLKISLKLSLYLVSPELEVLFSEEIFVAPKYIRAHNSHLFV